MKRDLYNFSKRISKDPSDLAWIQTYIKNKEDLYSFLSHLLFKNKKLFFQAFYEASLTKLIDELAAIAENFSIEEKPIAEMSYEEYTFHIIKKCSEKDDEWVSRNLKTGSLVFSVANLILNQDLPKSLNALIPSELRLKSIEIPLRVTNLDNFLKNLKRLSERFDKEEVRRFIVRNLQSDTVKKVAELDKIF